MEIILSSVHITQSHVPISFSTGMPLDLENGVQLGGLPLEGCTLALQGYHLFFRIQSLGTVGPHPEPAYFPSPMPASNICKIWSPRHSIPWPEQWPRSVTWTELEQSRLAHTQAGLGRDANLEIGDTTVGQTDLAQERPWHKAFTQDSCYFHELEVGEKRIPDIVN